MMKNVACDLCTFLNERGVRAWVEGFRYIRPKTFGEKQISERGYHMSLNIATEYGRAWILEDCSIATFGEEHDSLFCCWCANLDSDLDEVLNILDPIFSPDCDYVAFTSLNQVKRVFNNI